VSTQTIGAAGEAAAAAHLERLGYRILARRFRTRHGELDLVAWIDGTLVFVEVKARRTGAPFESLHEAKRSQVRRMAAAWLQAVADRPYAHDLRFDAIGVRFDAAGRLAGLEHLEGAF
jgi:putative endonuclease